MSITLKTALGAALLASVAGCTIESAIDEGATEASVASNPEGLYYHNLWEDPSISVCWVSDAYATERGWIKSAVERTFEDFTSVDFTGWGVCNGPADVVIDLDVDLWPWSAGAERLPSTEVSVELNPYVGEPRDLDGDGDLDFDGRTCWTGQPNSSNPYPASVSGETYASYHRRCVEVQALHEFFHVLGAVHEQNRDDIPQWCVDENEDDDGHEGSEAGYWDATSLSNYCNPLWYGDGLLSPLDYTGLQTFYGFDTNDQWWFGIGNVRDYGGVDHDQLMFAIKNSPTPLSGNKIVLVGDFAGRGRDDLFLYGPGSGTDGVFYSDGDRTFTFVTETVSGSNFAPAVGDFDGDDCDDIFWYAPGSTVDKLWWGSKTGEVFDPTTPTNVTPTYDKALAGDFDGDGFDDIFWYASGSAVDKVWYGREDRTFDEVTPTNAITVYQPFVGDFDGDGFDDIFWYRPGTGQDKIWFGNGEREFDSQNVTQNGTYDPTAGDFDGNGTTDVLWSGTAIEDSVWLFSDANRAAKLVTYTSSHLGSNTSGGHSKPYAGDFDGNGKADVFWYKPN